MMVEIEKYGGYIFFLIVLLYIFTVVWFENSFYNAAMFLTSSFLGLITYQNYEQNQPKLIAQVVETTTEVTYTQLNGQRVEEKKKTEAKVLRLIIVNTGRLPILITNIENKARTPFLFSFIDQKAQIQNIQNYKNERDMGYLLKPYKGFEGFIQIDEEVEEMGIKTGKENKRIYKESSQLFIRDVTSNRKSNPFVFIDIFKSCIILGLIFQQSFNYHERLLSII